MQFFVDLLLHHIYFVDLLLRHIWYPALYPWFTNLTRLPLEAQTVLCERYQQIIKGSNGEVPKLYDISEQLLKKSFGEEKAQVVLAMLRARMVDLALVNEINDVLINLSHVERRQLLICNLLTKIPDSHNKVYTLLVNANLVNPNSDGVTDEFFGFVCRCYPEISSSNDLRAILDCVEGMTRDQCKMLEMALDGIHMENQVQVQPQTQAQAQPASFPWGKVAMATVVVVVGGLAVASGLGWVSLGIIV